MYRIAADFEAWTNSVLVEIDVNLIQNKFISVFGTDITYGNEEYPYKGYSFTLDRIEHTPRQFFNNNRHC